MSEPVSLDDIRRHLVLDPDDTEEDDYLTALLLAARRACELRLCRRIGDLEPDDMAMVAHAIRLIVGHWYANREAVGSDNRTAVPELPIAVTWLLEPLRVMYQC